MTNEQLSLAIATILKPFAALAIVFLLLCIRYAVIKYWPEGFIKRLLLIRLHKHRSRSAK